MNIYVDKQGSKINPEAAITFNGVLYNGNILSFPVVVAEMGLRQVEVTDPPEDFNPEIYYVTESDDYPYITYTRKSESQISELMLSKAKQQRLTAVEQIKVTTESGKTFDANETSQNRMTRAIIRMSEAEETPWVLSDNTLANVSREELCEALRLAGDAQTIEWMKPYAIE